ncbi:ABC transporter permease [Actinomadura viridis]|uniref:ABC-type dipeptide/oligopeptide/nickel transport system permease subunit n=1 Tax=Actinomadura viridis TaxID=58110 RepID=A0A931DQ04_9ACTN|nr:ABC transporter permease [Actinomadura viridis]MBG6091666.1 ABC-type dipeptide/oligopeptide/nickel transport system permease subunit [Actinomadura viridis]
MPALDPITVPVAEGGTPPPGRPRAPRGLMAFRAPVRRPGLWAAALVLGAMALLAALAPWLTPYDPIATDTAATGLPPGSPGHPLGTDLLGRDLLSRLLHGARTSLLVGLAAAAITVGAGLLLGGAAAAGPRRLDELIARSADVLLSLPMLVVVLALAAVLGPSLGTVIVAVAVTGWMPVALVTRAELISRRERLYVRAAYGLGLSRGQVLRRHLLPGALPPIASIAAFEVGHAILTESTLSFLGLGVPPNRPSWGNLLTEAQAHLLTGEWYTVAFPAACVVVTILAVNVLASAVPADEGSAW